MIGPFNAQKFCVDGVLDNICEVSISHSYLGTPERNAASTRSLPHELAKDKYGIMLSHCHIDVVALDIIFQKLVSLRQHVNLKISHSLIGNQASSVIASYISKRMHPDIIQMNSSTYCVELTHSKFETGTLQFFTELSFNAANCSIITDYSSENQYQIQFPNATAQPVLSLLPSAPDISQMDEGQGLEKPRGWGQALPVSAYPATDSTTPFIAVDVTVQPQPQPQTQAPYQSQSQTISIPTNSGISLLSGSTPAVQRPLPKNSICTEGWLHKLPCKSRVYFPALAWRKRYFVLGNVGTTVYLDYFMDDTKRDKRGTLLINGYQVVDRSISGKQIMLRPPSGDEKQTVGDFIIIGFQNDNEMTLWRRVLQQTIAAAPSIQKANEFG